jgi:hypothetical protein
MSDNTKMTGGCMCGAVRYEATGVPLRHGLIDSGLPEG